jgi:hypothetical protein
MKKIVKNDMFVTCKNGICMKKIVKNDMFVTCKNCTLDFHVKCIDTSDIDKCINWYCKNCFLKTSYDELPFSHSDYFIDLQCKLQKGLKIAHINIRSLVNLLLHDNNIDVLCISETHLTDNISDMELHINGYSITRLDRQQIDKTHGGILCYVKDNIAFKQNIDLYDKDIEAIFIEINLPKNQTYSYWQCV